MGTAILNISDSRLSSPAPSKMARNSNWQRTIVFIRKTTVFGENVFLRGGIHIVFMYRLSTVNSIQSMQFYHLMVIMAAKQEYDLLKPFDHTCCLILCHL